MPAVAIAPPTRRALTDAPTLRPTARADAPATHRRRVRDRLARRLVTASRASRRSSRCSNRCSRSTAARTRRPTPGCCSAATTSPSSCHRGQLRKSGDPYITHPLAVATILAELGMDTTTLVAALLHDTVEDTGMTARRHRRASSAPRSRTSSTASPSWTRSSSAPAAEAETIRKMVVAMARDPRVLVIKLADRLHNMRTLRFLPPEKQERKARETLEVLAPLAHRLGMNTIKWELEDLAFATLYPKRYDEIVRLVAERAPSRDTYLGEVIERINTDLRDGGIKAEVTGRPKHYYSIYQKMIVRGREFTDIYDLVGIRVLVDTERDCYATLGVDPRATGSPCPAGSRTTSRCRSSTCTSRCTRR